VVYDTASASTHLLSAEAGLALQILLESAPRPWTAGALAQAALAHDVDLDAADWIETLEGLAAVGLAWRTEPA
jgi:hypothetical protein